MAFRMEQLIAIGVLVIILGFIMIFVGAFGSKDSKSSTKVAVGGFIGPIPFGFGNDKGMVWTVIVISAVVMIIWFVFGSKLR